MSMATSQLIAHRTLLDILTDFKIPHPGSTIGPDVVFEGSIPPPAETKSEKINLSLIGSIPSLANAVAAAQIYEARGGCRQSVAVDLRRGHSYVDPDVGMTPTLNGQEIPLDVFAGNPYIFNIYETKDSRFVVLSGVYVDLVYQWSAFLGCSMAESDIREHIKRWTAQDLETAATNAGLPMAVCQTEESWKSHPHGAHLSRLPWVPSERISSSSAMGGPEPPPFLLSKSIPHRPLSGLKVLCVTHAIAGPSTGRTLAEHGASVLQVTFTHGFEHYYVYTYANLGTASSRLNLHKPMDRERLQKLVREAHVWIDSYRPHAIAKFGFSDEDIFNLNPSMIICHVRCYGTTGPWSSKPGFDMQGSASSGLMSYMGQGIGDGCPRWPPGLVINDYTTGYSGALAIQSIILKRLTGEVDSRDGWVLSPSLTGTAMGILKYYKTSRFGVLRMKEENDGHALSPETIEAQTGLGYLKTLSPLPKMSVTPIRYEYGLLQPMGSSLPEFPGYRDSEYDMTKGVAMPKEMVLHKLGSGAKQRLENLRRMGTEFRTKSNAHSHQRELSADALSSQL